MTIVRMYVCVRGTGVCFCATHSHRGLGCGKTRDAAVFSMANIFSYTSVFAMTAANHHTLDWNAKRTYAYSQKNNLLVALS